MRVQRIYDNPGSVLVTESFMLLSCAMQGEMKMRSRPTNSPSKRPGACLAKNVYSQKSEAISMRLPSGSATIAERIFQGSSRGP